MNCAKCAGELQKVTVGGVEVDQCPKCFGTWFDFGELKEVLGQEDSDKLKALHSASGRGGQDAKRGSCPCCGANSQLTPLVVPGKKNLHVDTCLVCYGQWLDGGEIEALRKKGLFESAAGFFKKLIKKK
jgi:Zn-finger nucleic acid-binding protein